MSTVENIIIWVILIGLPLLFVWSVVRRLIKRHRTSQRIQAEWSGSQDEPPLVEQHVRVIDKRYHTESVGIKTPTLKHHFIITVQYDNGSANELSVDKDIFDTISDNAVGTLAIVGERVYGFCED